MTDIATFAHSLTFAQLPAEAVQQAKRCLLDLIGVAAGGRQTRLSDIACRFAARHMGTSECGARILFDGRKASPIGAAYAGASTIDALDAHDGHALTKGHAGAALLPGLLAVWEAEDESGGGFGGREFLTCLTLGYEVAIRAGIALHASVPDYHTSGAWNALGCASMAARLLRLDQRQTREAFGVAEFHGPRSQMMRCIDHPTMVKDGSGWGALTGISAAYLAADGFTGAPALTMEDASQSALWADLGRRWYILEQYFKPEPICRWAQPATEAARQLRQDHNIMPDTIDSIRIETFHAAVRLGLRLPATTEEAQYAIGFPVAAMLARGCVGVAEIADKGIRDPAIRTLAQKISLVESKDFTSRFPAERVAVVSVTLKNGRIFTSPPTRPRGDPSNSLSDEEIQMKFRTLAGILPVERQDGIARAVECLDTDFSAMRALSNSIFAPVAA